MRASSLYWKCQLTGWTLYACANVILGALYGNLSLEGVSLGVIVSVIGLGASHALRAVILHRGWLRLPVPALALRMTTGSVVTAVGMALVAFGIFWLVRSGGENAKPLVSFFTAAFNWTALLFIWSLVYSGVHVVRRWRESERGRARAEVERWRLEAIAREAELRALQAQVNPHFLFNSLNTVRALVAEDPDRARGAITELADLLRYALAAGTHKTVPLAKEIATVRRYLALEQLRFEHRLQTDVRADPDALGAQIPPMVIQTLVENAIKHGIGATPEGGRVRVEARAEAGGVRVIVESPGVLDTEAEPESGVGLANATERLRRLCGDRAALVVRQADPHTVRAEVLVPLADRRPEPLAPEATRTP